MYIEYYIVVPAKMNIIPSIVKFNSFCNKDFCFMSGYAYGFMYNLMPVQKTLESPLSNIISASITGILYAFGTSIVHTLLPRRLSFTIPVCQTASLMYFAYFGKPDMNWEFKMTTSESE